MNYIEREIVINLSNETFTNNSLAVLLVTWSCANSDSKQIEVKPPAPFLPVPVQAQLNRHKAEYIRIILEERFSAQDISFPATEGVRLKEQNALACPCISTFQVSGSAN